MTHRSASPASSAASSSSSTACSWKESSHPESWQKQNVRTQRVLDVRRAKNPAVDGLKLDCLRATLSATRIVARDTKECLYSITVDANACSPTTTGLHRGPVLDNQSRRLASSPFATLKGKSIYINDKNQPKSSSVTKVKRRDFLYSSGFFGQANRFKVQDAEYKLHRSAGSQDISLVLSDDPAKTPLCRFKAENENGQRSSTIEILPRAISSEKVPRPHALIQNGKPTPLLDAALIAEKVYRANFRKNSNESSVDTEDDYSSDLNGEA